MPASKSEYDRLVRDNRNITYTEGEGGYRDRGWHHQIDRIMVYEARERRAGSGLSNIANGGRGRWGM